MSVTTSAFLEDSNSDINDEKTHIKSALKSGNKSIKKSVSFAVGTKNGNNIKSNIIKQNPLINPEIKLYKNDDESIIIKNVYKNKDNNDIIKSNNEISLDLTNFKFGTQYSASETDDEKNFEKLTKKFCMWSPQYKSNQKKIIDKQIKLKERKERLNMTKTIINNLKRKRGDTNDGNNRNTTKKVKGMNIDEYKAWKKNQNKRGVIYLKSLPFGCTQDQLKKIFSEFGVITNIYLETLKNNNGTNKKIYDRWFNYCEGWIEFESKKIAKMVAKLINDSKIPKKYVNNKIARNFTWKIKYLKGFKWHHLKEYKTTIRQLQRKKYDLAINEAHRQTQYFKTQIINAKNAKNDVINMNNNEIDSIDDNKAIKRRKIDKQRYQNVRPFKMDDAIDAIKNIWNNNDN